MNVFTICVFLSIVISLGNFGFYGMEMISLFHSEYATPNGRPPESLVHALERWGFVGLVLIVAEGCVLPALREGNVWALGLNLLIFLAMSALYCFKGKQYMKSRRDAYAHS